MPCNSSKPGNYVHVGYRQRISQFVKYCAFFFSSAHNCYSHPATSVLFIHNHDSGAHTVHVLHVHEPSEMHTVSNSLQRSSEVDTLKTVSRRRGGRKRQRKKRTSTARALSQKKFDSTKCCCCAQQSSHTVCTNDTPFSKKVYFSASCKTLQPAHQAYCNERRHILFLYRPLLPLSHAWPRETWAALLLPPKFLARVECADSCNTFIL